MLALKTQTKLEEGKHKLLAEGQQKGTIIETHWEQAASNCTQRPVTNTKKKVKKENSNLHREASYESLCVQKQPGDQAHTPICQECW